MRAPQRGKGSVYEVRCLRCDVSFPVETKTCLHCGGPTSQAGPLLAPMGIEEVEPAKDEIFGTPGPISVDEGPFDAIERGQDGVDTTPIELWPDERDAEQPDAAPSFVKSILRSFGGLVWVALLIAFSLARDCGD